MAVEGVPPFALYVPGADRALNNSRRLVVRGVVLHTTQGTDSRGLGSGRRHSTPGTFNFLIRQGVLYCYYPAWVRCSHAAGGNYIGPGIEIDMYDGNPVSAADLRTLGRLILWLSTTYSLPLTYKVGDPRMWADQNLGFRGFIAHAGLDYPPNTSFRHTDNITTLEFARALAYAGAEMVTLAEFAAFFKHEDAATQKVLDALALVGFATTKTDAKVATLDAKVDENHSQVLAAIKKITPFDGELSLEGEFTAKQT